MAAEGSKPTCGTAAVAVAGGVMDDTARRSKVSEAQLDSFSMSRDPADLSAPNNFEEGFHAQKPALLIFVV